MLFATLEMLQIQTNLEKGRTMAKTWQHKSLWGLGICLLLLLLSVPLSHKYINTINILPRPPPPQPLSHICCRDLLLICLLYLPELPSICIFVTAAAAAKDRTETKQLGGQTVEDRLRQNRPWVSIRSVLISLVLVACPHCQVEERTGSGGWLDKQDV